MSKSGKKRVLYWWEHLVRNAGQMHRILIKFSLFLNEISEASESEPQLYRRTSLTNSTVFLLLVSRRVSSTKLSQRPLQSSGSSKEREQEREKEIEKEKKEAFSGSLPNWWLAQCNVCMWQGSSMNARMSRGEQKKSFTAIMNDVALRCFRPDLLWWRLGTD